LHGISLKEARIIPLVVPVLIAIPFLQMGCLLSPIPALMFFKTHLLLRTQLKHPLLHHPVSKSDRPTPALQQFLEDWPRDWPAPGSSSRIGKVEGANLHSYNTMAMLLVLLMTCFL
jgi:hypothetical protein